MLILDFGMYLLTGALAGLLAGLLGVGGGIIVVPMLVIVFEHHHFPRELVMHMAVGTSFAVMMFTSISSTVAYSRRDLIEWPLFFRFVPGLLFGTVSGASVAHYLSGDHLRVVFGIFLIVMSLYLAFQKTIVSHRSLPSSVLIVTLSFFIGVLSGLFGIGGGAMMVPFFLYCHLTMHRASGTSAVCSFPLAVLGTVSLIITGWATLAASNDPALYGSTGFVYWPAALITAITSLIFAPIGARLGMRLPNRMLKRIFSVLLILIAGKLLFN